MRHMGLEVLSKADIIHGWSNEQMGASSESTTKVMEPKLYQDTNKKFNFFC